ncbi:hypothetical protein [Faecalibacillus intestinalis]|uniref:hypothetical protein n=1 Tax=Faecalibacillus intestinalis TaxID=1982626 RepID=UPI0022E8E72E|nr:hypothetical protein [Faecalibacillus intestinalis]
MENTLYFKDMRNRDDNNYPEIIYKVEHSRMLIEILDNDHIHGKPHYFSSPHSRDNFLTNIKEHILRITDKELEEIQTYWKKNNL